MRPDGALFLWAYTHMQRIRLQTRVEAAIPVLQEKLDLLHRHFPPSIANTFAIPRKNAQGVEWWTELQGQSIAYADLPVQAQQKMQQVVDERLGAIRNLADKLQREGRTADAQALQTLVGQPDMQQLWSIHGEPLITGWGVQAIVPPAAPVAPATPAAVPLPPPVPPRTPRRPFPWRWLLWPLLALLLLALLWWLWLWWSSRPVPAPLPVAAAPDKPFACKKDAAPPDFVMVLDTSGSMNLNINTSASEEKKFFSSQRIEPWRAKAIMAEPQRMTVAKRALENVVKEMHPSISTHLITFGSCGKTIHRGLFSGQERASLVHTIHGLKADGGTPIAQSLRHAASLVDGKDKDAMVLLFVDGEDGCEENACAVAETLHQQKPRLRVNVVNISAQTMSNCVAEKTGGRVYAATDAAEITRHLSAATQEILSNRNCDAEGS